MEDPEPESCVPWTPGVKREAAGMRADLRGVFKDGGGDVGRNDVARARRVLNPCAGGMVGKQGLTRVVKDV